MEGRENFKIVLSLTALAAAFGWVLVGDRGWETNARSQPAVILGEFRQVWLAAQQTEADAALAEAARAEAALAEAAQVAAAPSSAADSPMVQVVGSFDREAAGDLPPEPPASLVASREVEVPSAGVEPASVEPSQAESVASIVSVPVATASEPAMVEPRDDASSNDVASAAPVVEFAPLAVERPTASWDVPAVSAAMSAQPFDVVRSHAGQAAVGPWRPAMVAAGQSSADRPSRWNTLNLGRDLLPQGLSLHRGSPSVEGPLAAPQLVVETPRGVVAGGGPTDGSSEPAALLSRRMPNVSLPAVPADAAEAQGVEVEADALEAPADEPALASNAPAAAAVEGEGNAALEKGPVFFTWQAPAALLAELEALHGDEHFGDWTRHTAQVVRRLCNGRRTTLDKAAVQLDDLKQQLELARHIAGDPSGRPDHNAALHADQISSFRRTAYSVTRRYNLWRQTCELLKSSDAAGRVSAGNSDDLAESMQRVSEQLAADPAGEGWRQYLMLDALASLTQPAGVVQPVSDRSPRDAQTLARLVVERLEAKGLDESQRAFTSTGPMAELKSEVRRWAAEPVSLSQLLFLVESYEQTGDAVVGRRLASLNQRLALCGTPEALALSQNLESHYRNHNVRVAVSAELIDRWTPRREAESGYVNDTILGLPVRGRQTTHSDVKVKLVPDDQRIALALAVTGQVQANTYAVSGPATVYTGSASHYSALKPIALSPAGVSHDRCQVNVNTTTRLQDLTTDFDRLPLFGAFVRAYAHGKVEDSEDDARAETRMKVARRVESEVDGLVGRQLETLQARYTERVAQPLAALDLSRPLLEMKTSASEITVRGRLADDDQLGSHTPRPVPAADSLASMQMHESAMNNLFDQLGLAGGVYTPQDVHALMVEKFNLPTESMPRLIGRNVSLKFASVEPIRVRLADGRLHLTLRLDRVENGLQSADNVVVRVSYQPVVGEGILLDRDGNISLDGDGLRGRTSLAVRAIFTKVFPKERPWVLATAETLSDPRLSGLRVSQFLLHDGWLSLSLSPSIPPTALRPTVHSTH